MTRQYVVGELSALLGTLRQTPTGDLCLAVERLRHEIEGDSRGRLTALVLDALDLADQVCWASLERGDIEGFERCARTTVALQEFARGASLLA
jgi:hypothetical protein